MRSVNDIVMSRQQKDGSSAFGFGQQEICSWSVVMAAVAYWCEVVTASYDPHLPFADAVLQSILIGGAFGVAAWAMIFARFGRLVPDRPAPTHLLIATLAVGVLCAVPVRPTTALALAALGGWLRLAPGATRSGRQAGLLLLALSLTWASSCLAPLHVIVGRLDAHAVAWLSNLAGIAVTPISNTAMTGDFGVEILAGCTSSWQLPDVLLAFVVVVLYRRGECQWRDLPFLLAALVASIVLTELRLSLMVRNEADFLWWHDGNGSTIYSLAALASAITFPLLATLRTNPVPATQPA